MSPRTSRHTSKISKGRAAAYLWVIVPTLMLRPCLWSLTLLVLPVLGCSSVKFRERPEWVNHDPLPIQAAPEGNRGTMLSLDTVKLESPLDGSRHTDDARRALEVALNDAGYALTNQKDQAVQMKVIYTAKYKDYAKDNWADECCLQIWAICATAHLARLEQTLEDLTVCDENIDVRDIADLGMERIAAMLVASLNQDETAKIILKNEPLPLPAGGETPDTDE